MKTVKHSRRIVVACGLLIVASSTAAQETIQLGTGSYHADVPDGRERPSDSSGTPVQPRTTVDYVGPIATNDWSSSIVYPRYQGNSHGQPMFPWPMSAQCSSVGVLINGAPELYPGNGGYFSYFNSDEPDVTVGIAGLSGTETRLAEQGDWSITTALSDGTRSLRCTITRGLPFTGFHVDGGRAELRVRAGTTIVRQDPGMIVFNSGGSIYAAFTPDSDEWTRDGDVLRSTRTSGGWFNLGILPDASNETIELFHAHAFVEVTGTQVSWEHDSESARILATYAFETLVHQGEEHRVLTGLLPHQLMHCEEQVLGASYLTARGRMELVATEAFVLSIPTAPILPGLPPTADLDLEEIRSLLFQLERETNPISAPDSYWAGKQLGRVASAAEIAHQIGELETRNRLVDRLQQELEDWFSTGPTLNENRLEAEAYTAQQGTQLGPGEDGGQAVLGIGDGDETTYTGIDLEGRQPARVLLRYASGAGAGGSGLIRLRLDDRTGPIIAEAAVGNSGGWDAWSTVALAVAPETGALLDGSRALVFTCESGYSGDLLSLDWLEWDLPGDGGATDKDLAYCPDWNTLLAHPGSYGMATELNDHHFHYGYFIAAAATIARFDPAWADSDRWGGMVDLLIKDAANWDRTDQRFPFLRNFEPYAGHAYASGHAGFTAGNNQESSSESTHFAQAVVLWGEATGREDIRDLGLYLHALEAVAIEQYWFDVDQDVYPPGAEHPLAGIVWDAGATYATWWTGNPEEIHGINLLPITGGSLYLGRRPEAMERAWQHLIQQNGGPPVEWRDVLWAWRALFDADSAESWLESETQWSAEPGHSRAFITYWIRSHARLGRINHGIVADSPTAAVFERDGTRSYVAYNAGAQEREVLFSDGTSVCVGPGETRLSRSGSTCTTRPADLDDDGYVGGSDLTLLIGSWGPCTTPCAADLDGDGTVGGADLTRLLADWD